MFTLGVLLRYGGSGLPAHTRRITAARPARVTSAGILLTSNLLLLFAHLASVALPHSVLAWNRAPLRLYLLEGTLFVTGLAALIVSCTILRRHLRSPEVSLTAIADATAGTLLCIVTASGLLVACLYRWGSSWGAAVFSPYVISLLRLEPREGLFGTMPLAVRMHVLSAFAALAILPFTSPARIAVAAWRRRVRQATSLLESRGSVAVAALRGWVERHGIAARIWPEEED